MIAAKEQKTVWLNKAQYDGFDAMGLYEGIRPEIQIEKSIGSYRLKIAETLDELLSAFTLRHQVFFNEGGAVGKSNSSMDMDEFDLVADHLVLIDDRIGEVVGTYRMIRSSRTDRFYSQGEFHMDQILKLEGPKLELGRACIHKDYRNGAAIALVWQGLGEFLKRTGTRWLFGCSSVGLQDLEETWGIGANLIRKYNYPGADLVKPLHPHEDERLRFSAELAGDFTALDASEKRFKIPPLLKGYLSAGAGICGAPSWDPEFNTVDFFTLMDVEKMNPDFVRRFGVK